MRDQIAKAFTAADAWNHAREEIGGFFGGLDVADPGLVLV
jgi:hypothetical protein